MDKKKILVIGIIIMGITILGGTFALLVYPLIVENGNITGKVECFEFDYSIENSSSSSGNTQITGTLFPSSTPVGGLKGRVALKVKSSCNVSGLGTLNLHINETTSPDLLQEVTPHCENIYTQKTEKDLISSEDCLASGNNKWVTNASGIKYAVYNNVNGTGNPLSVGYIHQGDIGHDMPIYTGFTVNQTQREYYIFIWMDGHVTSDIPNNLSFSGYINATVIQN